MKHFYYSLSVLIKLFVVFVIFHFLGINGFAQTRKIKLNDKVENGLKVRALSKSKYKIIYSLNELQLYSSQSSKRGDYGLRGLDLINMNDEGAPNLPSSAKFFAVPQGSEVTTRVVTSNYRELDDIYISPSALINKEIEPPAEEYRNEKIYQSDAYYPDKVTATSKVINIRGMDVALVSLCPYQYNPVKNKLRVYEDIIIEVSFNGGSGEYENTQKLNRWWFPIIKGMLVNPEVINQTEFEYSASSNKIGAEYLIISPNGADFVKYANKIRDFRNRQGILTKVVTLEETGATSEEIKEYIRETYNEWDIAPAAILLLGDDGNDPNTSIKAMRFNNYCQSDNIFVDLDENDLPDIAISRITARNAKELKIIVDKLIDYEMHPPENADYYNTPLISMGWQLERWFQLCTETVLGFFKNKLRKEPQRENAIYSSNPMKGVWSTARNTESLVNYFGSEGLKYIGDNPDYLTDWNGSNEGIIDRINKGTFFTLHRNHGGVENWETPYFGTSDIGRLNNKDLTYVFSINCLTGKFEGNTECFAEKMHRSENGAVGIIAATESSYSFVNDVYLWGMIDYLWPDFLPEIDAQPVFRNQFPAFASVAGKYFLERSGWPYNSEFKDVTYHLYHCHGDAFTPLFSKKPRAIKCNYSKVIIGAYNKLSISAEEGALICISKDNEILATGTGIGETIEIEVPPQENNTLLDLVITKQNCYRIEDKIEVVPPSGAFCIYKGHAIHNEDGIIEKNEDLSLDVTIENVGIKDTEVLRVELESDNPAVRMLRDTYTIRQLEKKESFTIKDCFKFRVLGNLTNESKLVFNMKVSSADDQWKASFNEIVTLPDLQQVRYYIDDNESGNNNGVLDPGETVKLFVELLNNGNQQLEEASLKIDTYNPYVSIINKEADLSALNPGEKSVVSFDIGLSDDVPEGVTCDMLFQSKYLGYNFIDGFEIDLSSKIENFESGDFKKFPWYFKGQSNWEISNQYAYDGKYFAKSGLINNNYKSIMNFILNVAKDDSIKFMKRVSSEQYKDFLVFYIDDHEKKRWSGRSEGWTKESFFIEKGTHKLTWVYKKNNANSQGYDGAFIDNIELPNDINPTVFAGFDENICCSEQIQLNGLAKSHKSMKWKSSGSGTFSSPTEIKTNYILSNDDLLTETIDFTLEIRGVDDKLYSHTCTYTLMNVLDQPLIEGDVEVGEEATSQYFIDSDCDIVEWEAYPSFAGTLINEGKNLNVQWLDSFIGEVKIRVRCRNQCGWSEWSEYHIINVE
ncbi:MAG: C25 family cysteine peptidase [Hyphomicrobiales bacterium]